MAASRFGLGSLVVPPAKNRIRWRSRSTKRLKKLGRTPNLKLFATDVHKSSLEHAGRGIYPQELMKGMSEERLKKYFVPRENGYQVSPEIRRSIVFAPHNVLSDAPFTDLDFVSCRNLLIYFQNVAQTRALSMFHYALNKGSIMLLGGSESPGELSSEFDVVHERARIYRKRRSRPIAERISRTDETSVRE